MGDGTVLRRTPDTANQFSELSSFSCYSDKITSADWAMSKPKKNRITKRVI